MITDYVCGFLFKGENADRVVLIRKNKPEWQAGNLNGVGGKVEPAELALDAMKREFKKETGANFHDWKRFCTLDGPGHRVIFFRGLDPYNLIGVSSCTEEEVGIYSCDNLSGTIRNLHWLIPLALFGEIVQMRYA